MADEFEEVVFRLTKAEVVRIGDGYVGRAQLSVRLPDPETWQVIEKKVDGLKVRIRANLAEELMNALRDDNEKLMADLQASSDEIIRLRAELAMAHNELNQLKDPHYRLR